MAKQVTQQRIRAVLAGVLAPLVRTLLRCGVSYTEFADLAKRAYVDAASSDYGVRNRPTNISRVALMTGLSRKEVSRIRRTGGSHGSKYRSSEITLPAAVLENWHTNPTFSHRGGVPKVLPYAGRRNSFSALVRTVAGDVPPGAMRRELLRAGAIQVVDRNFLLAKKRHFVPDSASEKLLVGLELGVRRLVETIAFNTNSEVVGAARFQRFIEGPEVPPSELRRVRESLKTVLTRVSVEIDEHLGRYQLAKAKRVGTRKNAVRLGVGIYYFDDTAT